MIRLLSQFLFSATPNNSKAFLSFSLTLHFEKNASQQYRIIGTSPLKHFHFSGHIPFLKLSSQPPLFTSYYFIYFHGHSLLHYPHLNNKDLPPMFKQFINIYWHRSMSTEHHLSYDDHYAPTDEESCMLSVMSGV